MIKHSSLLNLLAVSFVCTCRVDAWQSQSLPASSRRSFRPTTVRAAAASSDDGSKARKPPSRRKQPKQPKQQQPKLQQPKPEQQPPNLLLEQQPKRPPAPLKQKQPPIIVRGVNDYEIPKYARPRAHDESLLGDLTGGRPGAIIETEEQLELKARILQEIQDGTRQYPAYLNEDYGELVQDLEAPYDKDDPTALDSATLGSWTILDLKSKFPYEWDPLSGDPDPNLIEMNLEGVRYLEDTEKDEEGVEVGYDPIFGPSNPMDKRTMLGARDSYMIDERTRDDAMLKPQFPPGDPEIEYNEDIVQFRRSLDIMETYIDPFLPADLPIPRHVAKWHGYPEQMYFEPKNFTNNRFTDPRDKTDFDALDPYRAREKAVELARAKNAEWMPDAVSKAWHKSQRQPYEDYGTLIGTLRKGECDPAIVEQIQPALKILGSCVELLSIHTIEDNDGSVSTVFRFHYHGLMKNKHGMSCWTETLIKDCGVDSVTGVVFETGFRRRDSAYDGGDPWYGPS